MIILPTPNSLARTTKFGAEKDWMHMSDSEFERYVYKLEEDDRRQRAGSMADPRYTSVSDQTRKQIERMRKTRKGQDTRY